MISLYFHLPFCRRKCPYCHFFVIPEKEADKDLLLEALLRHLEQISPQLAGKQIPSIYFGGGTPTLFGAKRLGKLLEKLPLEGEITIEANPEEVTVELIRGYRNVGVNRVSMGVQSLDNALLKTLGRNHSASKAIEAVHAIHTAGIANISIDLMYELPGQSLESFEETLTEVGKLPITHLSLYNLTIEPQTPFYKKKETLIPLLPSGETNLAMLEMAIAKLNSFGLKRYEISAFAKEGFESCHNTGYWTARPFLGLGPSAFSYYEGRRFRNVSNLRKYAETLGTDFEECLPYPANIQELLAVELRLLRGVNLSNFEPLPQIVQSVIRELIQEGFLVPNGDRLLLSEQGLLFYDSVATRII